MSQGGEDGFVLPFVLVLTMFMVLATAAMLGVVTSNVVPARNSQNTETASAAAQAGLDAYVAELNAFCSNYYRTTSNYSIQECSWPDTAAAKPLVSGSNGAPALAGAKYSAQATNTIGFLSSNQNALRVVSTGTSNGTSVKLVADIAGTPNALRFAYFTNHESTDPVFLAKYFPSRSISIATTSLSVLGLSVSLGSRTVTWPGLNSTSAANCGALWYDDPTNPTSGHYGRGTAGDTVTEAGALSPSGGVAPSITHTCSVAFSTGMAFNGPVYSHDALYVSNGVKTDGSISTTGPSFSVPNPCSASVTTACESFPPASSPWSKSDSPGAPDCSLSTCATNPALAAPFRSAPAPLGGTPTSTSANVQTVQRSYFDVTLPNNVDDAAAAATCTYTGATTIAISGTNATVSGPGVAGQSTGCISPAIDKTTLYVIGDVTLPAGTLTGGRVSVVATGDIIVTGDLLTTAGSPSTLPADPQTGEPHVTDDKPAIALVAQGSVRVAHSITCDGGSAPDATTGYCKNDVSGLYSPTAAGSVVSSDGRLKDGHPARAYCNSTGNVYPCSGGTKSTCDNAANGGRRIDAAVFALNGSLRTDNYNRGCALGTLTVNGGVYSNFRGPVGQEWEVPSSGASNGRSYSGYRLSLNYASLESAGLPYVPPLQGGGLYHPWQVLSVSGGK